MFEPKRHGSVVVIEIPQELDSSNLPTFSQKVDAMIEAGDLQLVLDLHALRLIHDAGLGYLIKMSKRVKGKGGETIFARPSKYMRRTLVTLGLDGLFTSFGSVEDAIDHFGDDGDDPSGAPVPR